MSRLKNGTSKAIRSRNPTTEYLYAIAALKAHTKKKHCVLKKVTALLDWQCIQPVVSHPCGREEPQHRENRANYAIRYKLTPVRTAFSLTQQHSYTAGRLRFFFLRFLNFVGELKTSPKHQQRLLR